MNFKRLLSTKLGVFFISAMLGLGLATLFRKACNGKDCIHFKGPRVGEIDGKIYQFGDSCYSYDLVPSKCDASKKTLELQPADIKKQMKNNVTDNDIHTAFEDFGKINKEPKQPSETNTNSLGEFFSSAKNSIMKFFS